MAFNRNQPKITETVTYPNIIDADITVEETAVNFKPVKLEDFQNISDDEEEEAEDQTNEARGAKPKVKPEKPVAREESDDEEEPDDAGATKPEAQANGARGRKPKDKKPKYPNFLQASAKYNFASKTLALCFWAKEHKWSFVSLSGSYKFTGAKIDENEFVEITGNDFVFNMQQSIIRGGDAKVFNLDVSRIDRHVLMKTFTVNLSFIFIEDVNLQLFSPVYNVLVPFFQKETKLQFKFLGHFHADKRITNLYNAKFKQEQGLEETEQDLLHELHRHQRQTLQERNSGNTIQMIKYALNIEDLASQDEMKEYALTNVHIDSLMNNYSFAVKAKDLPPNYGEMSLCIVPMRLYKHGKLNFEDDCIFVQMEKFQHGRISFDKKFNIDRDSESRRQNFLREPCCIRFVPNRITYRACFQALDMIQTHALHRFFDDFEDEPVYSKRENGGTIDKFEWLNPQIATNEEQMTAIKNIVNCTSYPFPYVTFGPPGTGKTSCIVECIAQILKHKPNSRIMVTAQSNSACDEVGVRLLKHISPNKIFRFYSPSLLNPNNGETSAALRRISNLRNGRNEYPTREEFGHFSVMIVTLMSCSRLVQLDGENMNRNFDYIFVDECAAATEPEAYVPIMGLGTDLQEITTNIVLLGDHKQLGPVINSDIASRLGLGLSLMERIMSKRRYRKNPFDNSFDKNYVTQLLDNYRSHPAILQFSNVLFYDSKLRAKAPEPDRSFGTRWSYLNCKHFPVLFHCTKNKSKIVKGGTSSYNDGEIKLVRFYVDLLLKVGIDRNTRVREEDIGIVSPYKAQLHKLGENLRDLKGVEIGTAEYYQGREKKIIIISTVKSRDNVGFLKSEKRLNVCITRAKSLLILIGNADTLQQNSLWNSFLHFCNANNACCGETFKLTTMTEDEKRTHDQLNDVLVNLREDEEADPTPAIERGEALQEIYDRMEKLQVLIKKM